ncbi:hypothetical protein [Algisphaera agarilytica]|uniref:Cell division septum initiation protein DivIVA n=1 Tax=Algisphaera agarilytica TaxID=1385975 RepID=A0A7X0LMA1_9BACT|nr:hypothetical protein [Algisphaera agarilytica]MBB6431431.1 cell division septum initiation protein DivIVA [Algisphaera agarilytica]
MPRTADQILADLKALERENDRLEQRIALAKQSLKAAEARQEESGQMILPFLQRAESQLRAAG